MARGKRRFRMEWLTHKPKLLFATNFSWWLGSRNALQHRGITQLLGRMEEKDALLVSELSRLGRSLSQIIFLVDSLVKKRVRFVAIKEGIEFAGQADLQTKV